MTLVSGELSADGEATILDVPVGPYMFNLCGGELISMVSHADRAAILMQFGETVIKTIVRETLAELCRAMSSCAVVSDTPSGLSEAGETMRRAARRGPLSRSPARARAPGR